jgi:hypothetical protein
VAAFRERVVTVALEDKAFPKAHGGYSREVTIPALRPEEIALARGIGVLRVDAIEPDSDWAGIVDPYVGRHPVVLYLAIAEAKHVTVVVGDRTPKMDRRVLSVLVPRRVPRGPATIHHGDVVEGAVLALVEQNTGSIEPFDEHIFQQGVGHLL